MNNEEVLKRILLGLAAIVAIAAIIALVIFYANKGNKVLPVTNKAPAPAPLVKTTEVNNDKLPDKFPSDIPIESGATITQNYNATTTDGRYQATRAFETKKSLAENLALYTQYLQTNGWTIKATIDQPTYKMVTASKDKQQLQISISENSTSKVVTVTISLTILP